MATGNAFRGNAGSPVKNSRKNTNYGSVKIFADLMVVK
jgi:hypothetical protein